MPYALLFGGPAFSTLRHVYGLSPAWVRCLGQPDRLQPHLRDPAKKLACLLFDLLIYLKSGHVIALWYGLSLV